ncbi:MAG: hypothetical protein IIA85_00825 [Nanoarchaeota archaeon]|nr:hypothetical protein [Nanoarchaeota archaeon]
MKKIFAVFVIGIFLLATSGIFAESEEENDFVRKVAEKKGISETEIKNITEINFANLPKEINFANIDDSNLALYKIELKEGRPVFLITFSGKNIEKISSTSTQVSYSTSLLHFGENEETSGSAFLKTPLGVQGSLDKGYVMLRKGSITGISTNLEAVNGEGEIQIIIYKNGKEVGFRNSIDVFSNGIKKDYDIQSREIVTFNAGDIISVQVNIRNNGDITWKAVITIVEISN